MGKMKGVLSDSDMKILRQASTTLDPSMSEGEARAELDRLVQVMGRLIQRLTGASESADSLNQAAGAITVTAGGKTYSFADQAAADAFKKAAGIR